MFNFFKRFRNTSAATPSEEVTSTSSVTNIHELTNADAVIELYNSTVASYENRIHELEYDMQREAEYTARLEDLLIMYTQKAISYEQALDLLYEEAQNMDYSNKIAKGEY